MVWSLGVHFLHVSHGLGLLQVWIDGNCGVSLFACRGNSVALLYAHLRNSCHSCSCTIGLCVARGKRRIGVSGALACMGPLDITSKSSIAQEVMCMSAMWWCQTWSRSHNARVAGQVWFRTWSHLAGPRQLPLRFGCHIASLPI